ncbi:MAG TPA: MBL fold metallo-hydrolase, partial [bacterium]|nr:MBL fold metallo-hydrolase [bacterium]
VADLVKRTENDEPVHVLDVRAPFRLASGRIDIVPDERFHNVAGSELMARPDPGIPAPKDALLAVVCAAGNASKVVAQRMNALGYNAASVAGGMDAWMRATVAREVEAPAGVDRLVQIDRIGKGALGYLVVSGGEALIVDPPRDSRTYFQEAERSGAEVVAVADTHVHADYISGAPAIAARLGVPYHLHPADAVYPYDGTPGKLDYRPAEDGAEIVVGSARVTAVHTPGHTEGHLSWRIGDDAVLTGDFLFVRSVGRPDLGDRAEEWTPVLWRSLERARREWPESILVLPAHYSVAAERRADHAVAAAFGDLLRENEALGLDEEAFTRWVLGRTGEFPEAYRRIKAVNVGLENPGPDEMDELELGRNQCALG